jgi:hypothetical protein
MAETTVSMEPPGVIAKATARGYLRAQAAMGAGFPRHSDSRRGRGLSRPARGQPNWRRTIVS